MSFLNGDLFEDFQQTFRGLIDSIERFVHLRAFQKAHPERAAFELLALSELYDPHANETILPMSGE